MCAKHGNPMAGPQRYRGQNMTTASSKAVAWILEAPGRTQAQAAERFGITQAAVSYGLKTWRKQNPGLAGADGRRKIKE